MPFLFFQQQWSFSAHPAEFATADDSLIAATGYGIPAVQFFDSRKPFSLTFCDTNVPSADFPLIFARHSPPLSHPVCTTGAGRQETHPHQFQAAPQSRDSRAFFPSLSLIIETFG
jgi:hypothetical protein